RRAGIPGRRGPPRGPARARGGRRAPARPGECSWRLRVDHVVDVADHHLFPRLVAPTHLRRGVGVVRILLAVVEGRDGLQTRALPDDERLRAAHGRLPVEVVVGDVADDL